MITRPQQFLVIIVFAINVLVYDNDCLICIAHFEYYIFNVIRDYCHEIAYYYHELDADIVVLDDHVNSLETHHNHD